MKREDLPPPQGPVACVVGARPNFIKIAPLLRAFAAFPTPLPTLLVHTGQHYDNDMSDRLFADLRLPEPDINLEVGSASHAVQTAEVMRRFEPVLDQHQPSCVLVVGDVNSTLKAVRGGTQQISKAIAEAIDPERLMLECKVESVTASGGGVKVRYRRDQGEPEEVEASVCISAMTADAVLESMPDLPETKREALESVLPYAQVVTVAWLTDEAGPMPWDRLLAVPAIGLSFELLSNNAFFVRRDTAMRHKGGSLVTLATGPRAEALVALTDEAIVARVRADLLKMFPLERDVLERATTRVERWRGLPKFGKGWLGRQKVLREPFGRVHFCGDYTAQPGTPGAVGSGYHAASAVRALLG